MTLSAGDIDPQFRRYFKRAQGDSEINRTTRHQGSRSENFADFIPVEFGEVVPAVVYAELDSEFG